MDVYVKYCNNYENVQESINYLLDNVLDNGKAIKDNMTVFIKTNAVAPQPCDRAITTHPSIVRAVIHYLKKYNVKIIVGDNPATRDMKMVYKVNGTLEVVEQEKVNLANNKDLKVISAKDYKKYKDFNVSREIVEADILINIPKLKTHGLAYFTGAEKNLFGTGLTLPPLKFDICWTWPMI